MGRGKIQMKRIEKATNRQAAFSKRRNGLMKKAHELSVLCDAEVAVIIFSQSGRLHEFSSSDIRCMIERYRSYARAGVEKGGYMDQQMLHLKQEVAELSRQIEFLEHSRRKFLGQNLGSCSMPELEEIDVRLERSLITIRARKNQLFEDQIKQLEAKEICLREENARLHAKCGETPWNSSTEHGGTAVARLSDRSLDAETELFIGLPIRSP